MFMCQFFGLNTSNPRCFKSYLVVRQNWPVLEGLVVAVFFSSRLECQSNMGENI